MSHQNGVEDSLFLSAAEKAAISNWSYLVTDNSISTEILTPFWNGCLELVPYYVAPNLLTLAGLLCLLQSSVLTLQAYDSSPFFVGFLNLILIFAYQTLDAIDGKHARRTKNSSPVGELLDHVCDSVAILCIVVTICHSIGLRLPYTIFLVTNIAELVFMDQHLAAYNRKNNEIQFPRWNGPGEVLIGCLGLIALNMILPLHLIFRAINPFIDRLLFLALMFTVFKISKDLINKTDYITRDSIILCFGFRFLSSYMLFSDSIVPILAQNLFWCILTGDLIIAKMGKRNLHPLIPLFSMAAGLHYELNYLLFLWYFGSVFSCLLEHMRIPFLRMRPVELQHSNSKNSPYSH
jgi:phosphatidylglycerophosphate synthase